MLYRKLAEQKEKRKEEEETKAAEDEQKRKADKEVAAKAKAEEEATISKATKKKLKPLNKNNEENAEKDVQENVDESTQSKEEFLAKLEAIKKATEEEARKQAHEQAKKKEDKKAAQAKDEKQKTIKKAYNEENAEETDDVDDVFKKIQTMPFLNTSTRSKTRQANKDKEDKQIQKKETGTTKGKRTRKIKEEDMESNEKDEGSNNENEVLSMANGKKRETMKNKTKDSNPKEKKLRNNASEDEDDTKSESEEELKKLRKVKTKSAEENKKQQRRKRCLEQMGFERYIKFPIVRLPSTLVYHVIEKFHTPSMELGLQKGSIKATSQKVHDILGIQMRNTKLQDLEQREANDHFIDEWEEQYSHLQKPTPPVIALQISGTHEADFMFKINFITLSESTMGTLENGGRVPTKLLKCIKEEDDIAEIDWCDYILDCLRTSKLNWKDVKTKKNFYYGPLTFYVRIIRRWNTMMMRKRIKMETSQRCLESLEHHGEFDPKEENNGIDLYKGLDEYYAKIIQQFEKILKERNELIHTLTDGVTKFKDDQMMFDFYKQYKKMFNDAEFNLYESSKDEDSDNDSDPDQDNNKDDEEEPMADGKNKNKNERQSEIQKEKENIEDMDKGTEEGGSEANDNEEKDEDDVNIENEFKRDLVFETKDGAATIKDYMQTLAPQLKVESNVINTFSIVSNHKQKMNSKGKKMKYFFHTSMITKDMFKWKKANGEYDEETQFEAFSKTIKSEFKKDPEMKNMKDL
uniref:Uncharacterized protein n=1 Tax=Tanacetum cinerariifolium TaxID=118510 RepID=A0A6L2L8H5_TANCI|nr:hypothetical protein [Tanacetum cinerariifolium]